MPTAYMYIRFSSAEQAKGHSRERQEQRARAYAEREKLKLSPDVFFDEGVSGYTGKHKSEGELGRFIRMVESGEVARGSYLLVENLDRLSRLQLNDGLGLLNDLMRRGIVVVTLAPELVHKTGGDVTATLSAVMDLFRANSESARKGERLGAVFAKKRSKAQEGVPMGDTGPGWLRLNEDKSGFEREPVRTAAVQRIFQLAIEGYGKHTIARMLNAEGTPILSKRKNVSGWGSSAVHHVLRSRAVLGEFQPMTRTVDPDKERTKSGGVILNYYPQIISDETFALAAKAVEGRRVNQVTRTGQRVNLWGKVGKCMACGSQLHIENRGESRARPSKGSKYLGCSAKVKGKCTAKSVRLDAAEEVFALMLGRLPILELVKDSGAKLASQLDVLEAKILVARQTYEAKVAVFDVLPDVDVAKSMKAARLALDELVAQAESVKGDLAAEDAIDFKTFRARLDLSSDERRRKANAVLQRLKVQVFIGRERFVVTMDGAIAHFGLGLEGKRPGYFDIFQPVSGPFGFVRNPADPLHVAAGKAARKCGRFLHFVMPEEAGPYAFEKEEDASYRYEEMRQEFPITDVEAEALEQWANDGAPADREQAL